MSKPIEIAVLSGSVRMGRKSPQVAEYLVSKLKESDKNIQVHYLDLAEYNLPIMQERRGIHPNLPADAEKLGAQLENADAIIIVSPEYHGGYPGVLKNALDYFGDEFRKKPMAVVSVSSGIQGGVQAWEKLVGMFAKIGAFMASARMNVPSVGDLFDDEGKVQNDRFEKSAAKFIQEYLWFVEAIVEKKRK